MAGSNGQHSLCTIVAREFVDGALGALLDAVDEALMLVDAEHRLVAANARLWGLFGLTPTTSLVGIRNHILSCVADPDAYLEAVYAPPERLGGDGEEWELELVRPEARVVRRRVSALRGNGGGPSAPIGWLVSYRDVTHDAEVNRLKSEFVANVSHELRTPMAAIKGFLGIVLDDEETLAAEMRRHFLTIAKDETDRLSRLIDDLLDISRIESGRRRRVDSTFAVADLLADVVIVARPAASEAGLTVVLEAPPADWLLTADRDQLAQVLHNLVGNAVKYTAAGGSVRVGAEVAGEELRLRVADTGVGIAPEDLPKVCDKFYRCRSTGVGPRGAGLGLAIAKELVTAHRGRLEATSVVGAGSVFTVCLPWTRGKGEP